MAAEEQAQERPVAIYTAHSFPLFGRLREQMQLPSTINQTLNETDPRIQVDPGTIIAGLILNLLSDERFRLYRLPPASLPNPCPCCSPGDRI